MGGPGLAKFAPGRALGRTWVHRIPLLGTVVEAVGRARADLVRDGRLLAQSTVLQIATFACDAGTLASHWWLSGGRPHAAHVFAAFILARAAELVGLVPGGLGELRVVDLAALAVLARGDHLDVGRFRVRLSHLQEREEVLGPRVRVDGLVYSLVNEQLGLLKLLENVLFGQPSFSQHCSKTSVAESDGG